MLIVSRGYYSLTYLFSYHSLISHQDGAIDGSIDRAALAEVCTLWMLFSCF